jgi:hypothetical protein
VETLASRGALNRFAAALVRDVGEGFNHGGNSCSHNARGWHFIMQKIWAKVIAIGPANSATAFDGDPAKIILVPQCGRHSFADIWVQVNNFYQIIGEAEFQQESTQWLDR